MNGGTAMWIVIHMVKSETAGQEARDQLTREGFLAKLRPVYRTTNSMENYFELLVPRSEAQEARQVLIDHGLLYRKQ